METRDIRDMRDPQKVGEMFYWLRSEFPNKSAAQIADLIDNKFSQVTNYKVSQPELNGNSS